MNTSKMDKFQEKLQKVLVPIADKLSNQRHLAAVRDAMGILIPFNNHWRFCNLVSTTTC